MTGTGSTAISLWDRSAAEAEPAPDPLVDRDVTLAVIGGGFTGLSTALHAAAAGIDCQVIEANRIGHGGSGRNVGLVNAGLWLPPQDVRARLGEEEGARLIRLLGTAPDEVFSLIEAHQIRCEAVRNGTIHAAHSARGLKDLARRAAEWQRLGAPVTLLDRDDTAGKIGTRRYHGGLLDRRAGTINPMGYVRGLARAAIAAGARISTGTPVLALQRAGGRWHVATEGGTVTARHVVLATNAYSGALWPDMRRSFTTIRYFQVATEPLGARGEGILPEGQGIWTTAPIMLSLRRDAAGRLILGSMGEILGGDGALSRRWAARMLKRLFPGLGPVALEEAWHGEIAMTPDHLPRIHRLAEGLYAPMGYNGRGIAPGTVFGRAMAEMLTSGAAEGLPLPLSDVTPLRHQALAAGVYRAVFAANQVIGSR